VRGKKIQTLEGLIDAEGELHPVQRAVVEGVVVTRIRATGSVGDRAEVQVRTLCARAR
jgi:hypothetical protein